MMRHSLNKKRILITREKTQAKLMQKQIENNHGIAIVTPLLKIVPYYDKNKRTIFSSFKNYDWLFFTSVNGVNHFFNQLSNKKLITHSKIAAVGHKTAEAIQTHGYSVDFMPTIYNAETMAAEFLSSAKQVNHVLFVRGNLSRSTLLTEFTKANITYSKIVVYETTVNQAIKDDLLQKLKEGIDYLTFTSPSTVKAFVELIENKDLLHKAQQIDCFCIGTTTQNTAIKYNFKRTFIPQQFTIESMINKMIEVANKETS